MRTAIAILGTVISLPEARREFEEELHKQIGLTVGEVMGEDPFTVVAERAVEDAATLMHATTLRLPSSTPRGSSSA